MEYSDTSFEEFQDLLRPFRESNPLLWRIRDNLYAALYYRVPGGGGERRHRAGLWSWGLWAVGKALPPHYQPQKPVSYSVVKSVLVGLTRYFVIYWADNGIRVNVLCLGGVENNPPAEFPQRIGKLIPMGRMARVDEYQGAVVFLCSDASSYMNGAGISMDGGRTTW